MSEGFKDLKVFKMSYKLAMEIYNLSKSFPKEEIYALGGGIKISNSSKTLIMFNYSYFKLIKNLIFCDSIPPPKPIKLDDLLAQYVQILLKHIANDVTQSILLQKLSRHVGTDGEASETIVWIDFAKDCGYISKIVYKNIYEKYCEIGKMLGSMANHPERFIPKE